MLRCKISEFAIIYLTNQQFSMDPGAGGCLPYKINFSINFKIHFEEKN